MTSNLALGSAVEKSTFSKEYEIFLGKLVAARKKAGLTQEGLARGLRRTQSWVSKVERGERRIDVIELRDVCQALGCPFPLFVKTLEKSLPQKRPRHRAQASSPAEKPGA
ncbi:MAG TPA: helix-turn-helix transcriptional regulator [Candidatus Binataceae bacterium]|nr:helix-turn-helix transcriptional regulator [Candidatus Binataceae bacterium]